MHVTAFGHAVIVAACSVPHLLETRPSVTAK
jgi:hypothetical protein